MMVAGLLLFETSLAVMASCGWAADGGPSGSAVRLPNSIPPVMVTWFWREEEFEPEGFKPHVDLVARYSAADVLATSLRVWKKEVTDDDVRRQIHAATLYARRHGIGVAMDLDVRLAREAFRKAYPDELEGMLRLREIDLADQGQVVLTIPSEDLSDHYTFRTIHYIPLSGQLLRVYSYLRGPGGIRPETVVDITGSQGEIRVAGEKEVTVAIACDSQSKGRKACVMACFTHLVPSVFAPHLLEFQRGIIERYREVPLAGVCKDEWGFPPCYDGCPAKNDYWYSSFMASAYARRTGGRDFTRDCLLMTYGEQGREQERFAAINHFMDLCRVRNGELEEDFYRTVKSVFGPSAVVATHPTWYPYPGVQEFKKNGLDWWLARRDLAQTDEVTPYCVRTSLAKKWRSPLWYNMYYSERRADYDRELWSNALSGGRIDYHPLWPTKHVRERDYESLLSGSLMRGDCRVRLLNFIARAPLDCPVAVIFGQPCAMNWAGTAYGDVGMAVADGFWRAGFPADLIPSTELWNGSLVMGDDGYVRYGPQRYRAVVLYHPEFERPETAAFFRKRPGIAPATSEGGETVRGSGSDSPGRTMLYRMGEWTRNFDGQPLDMNPQWPGDMVVFPDAETCVSRVTVGLRQLGVVEQTPSDGKLAMFGYEIAVPRRRGHSRLIDGTEILIAGEKDVAGDPVHETIQVGGRPVVVDAVGVAGVRLTEDGGLDALAAGGLKRIEMPGFKIELEQRLDMALWRDPVGTLHGVVQGMKGPLPSSLKALTDDWLQLDLPEPFETK